MAVTRESTLDLSRDPSDPQPTFCLLLTSPLRFLLLREISQQGPSLSLSSSLFPLSPVSLTRKFAHVLARLTMSNRDARLSLPLAGVGMPWTGPLDCRRSSCRNLHLS